MNKTLKSKSLISIILSITILLTIIPLSATSPSPKSEQDPPTRSEHKQVINQFVSEIEQLLSQIFAISQNALENPPLFKEQLESNIDNINTRMNSLSKRISEYANEIPSTGSQNTHLLLVTNSLNFLKNGLYALNVLVDTRENVLRITILNEYFRARTAAMDTLRNLSELLAEYNT